MPNERGAWLITTLLLFIVFFAGFHLSKGWTKPAPWVVEAVTWTGWAVLFVLAIVGLAEVIHVD